MNDLMKLPEVQQLYRLTNRADVFAAVERKEIPQPKRRGARLIGWSRREIEKARAGR